LTIVLLYHSKTILATLMKIKYNLMITGISICLNTSLAMSQVLEPVKESPFSFSASYIGVVVTNFS